VGRPFVWWKRTLSLADQLLNLIPKAPDHGLEGFDASGLLHDHRAHIEYRGFLKAVLGLEVDETPLDVAGVAFHLLLLVGSANFPPRDLEYSVLYEEGPPEGGPDGFFARMAPYFISMLSAVTVPSFWMKAMVASRSLVYSL
jgi:hypothetical protein